MTRYRQILSYVSSHPWAIVEDRLDAIVELLRLRASGGQLADAEIASRLAAARAQQGERKAESFVGVIPVYGVIMPHANLMTEMSGGTTVDSVRAQFRAQLADPEVSRIIFDIDSPGGSVEGVPELGAEIRAARGIKPMTAVANYMAGSAAYWWATQADEFVASPSSMVGSVGVYGVHEDWSAANEQAGVKPTYISFGKYKTEGNPDTPLSDDGREHMQSLVDAIGDMFVKAVADGRGVSQKKVIEEFGEGRAFHPEAALARGMIDSIGTFDDVLASKPPRMRSRRQAAEGWKIPERVEKIEHFRLETDEQRADRLGAEGPDVAAELAEAPSSFDFERERRRRSLNPA